MRIPSGSRDSNTPASSLPQYAVIVVVLIIVVACSYMLLVPAAPVKRATAAKIVPPKASPTVVATTETPLKGATENDTAVSAEAAISEKAISEKAMAKKALAEMNIAVSGRVQRLTGQLEGSLWDTVKAHSSQPLVLTASVASTWPAIAGKVGDERWESDTLAEEMPEQFHACASTSPHFTYFSNETVNRFFRTFEVQPPAPRSPQPKEMKRTAFLEALNRAPPATAMADEESTEEVLYFVQGFPMADAMRWPALKRGLPELSRLQVPTSNGSQAEHAEVYIWMGSANATTTAHYDISHNMFLQVAGHTQFLLAAPSQWEKLHLFPNIHPSHRHSQTPEAMEQGSSTGIKVYEAVLDPGDVLYVPPFWFQHAKALSASTLVSVGTSSVDSRGGVPGSIRYGPLEKENPFAHLIPEHGIDWVGSATLHFLKLLLTTTLKHEAVDYLQTLLKAYGDHSHIRKMCQEVEVECPREGVDTNDEFFQEQVKAAVVEQRKLWHEFGMKAKVPMRLILASYIEGTVAEQFGGLGTCRYLLDCLMTEVEQHVEGDMENDPWSIQDL